MPAKPQILVVDDEWSIRDIVSGIMESEGYRIDAAENGAKAIELIDKKHYDVVVTDLKMPVKNGIEVLRYLQKVSPSTMGIVATAYATLETAIEAMRAGGFDYITKPFHMDELKIVVNRALEMKALRSENIQLKRQLKSNFGLNNLIGSSPQMKQLIDLIKTVAESDSTILITGESGTGKELVAKGIHYCSPRANKPLIPINCAAIPESLLESELFGHVKGAFTGATLNRLGRFHLADGGTIFLDEIGDMSPSLQVKILRVLQEQEFEPVGSTETIRVNVRILAATNKNLEHAVKEKEFREDLFYRLNVIPVILPTLRDRPDDIPFLIEHFCGKFHKKSKKAPIRFSDDAIRILLKHGWPGNVRELENLVERMTILCKNEEVTVEDLPEKLRPSLSAASFDYGTSGSLPVMELPDEGIDLNKITEEFETRLIRQALEYSNGVKNKAAKLLGLKRTTLVEKMKRRRIGVS